MPKTRLLAAVNLINADPKTVTSRPGGHLLLAFFRNLLEVKDMRGRLKKIKLE